jgi:hypothetical protein
LSFLVGIVAVENFLAFVAQGHSAAATLEVDAFGKASIFLRSFDEVGHCPLAPRFVTVCGAPLRALRTSSEKRALASCSFQLWVFVCGLLAMELSKLV